MTVYNFMFDDATVYYGPHECERCRRQIVKAGREFGSTEYDAPQGLVYPNHLWLLHNCSGASEIQAAPKKRPARRRPR